jgi:2-hydroxy-3-oxopropionate reductase
MREHVGFIGLGIMGKPMAFNLLASGCSLVVCNRSRGTLEELRAAGADVADTPAEVARRCSTMCLMLPDGPDVHRVVLGDDGILTGARRGSLLVDLSSISPDVAKEVADHLAEAGVEYVDAPVSGGETGAVARTLSIMCGGSESAVQRARPLLHAMGKTVVRVGDVGAGQATKLVNQVLVALHMQAMAEAFTLAERLGLDPQRAYDAIRDGLAGSNVLEAKVPKMLAGDFKPGFKVALHLKDLRNALSAAQQRNLRLPCTEFTAHQFTALVDAGDGGADHSALVKTV